jgi:phage shock protein E
MLKSLPELVAEARAGLRCLDAATAHEEMLENQGLVIDVREPVEVNDLSMPLSINLPRGILEMKIAELTPDADRPLYLHCATGGRATFAAEQLQRMGYTRVTVITCPVDQVKAAQEKEA